MNSKQMRVAFRFLVLLSLSFLAERTARAEDPRLVAQIRADETNAASTQLVGVSSNRLNQLLAVACEAGAAKWVALLIGLKADVNHPLVDGRFGSSCLEVARNLQKAETVQLLVRSGARRDGLNDLMLAVITGDKDAFTKVLGSKAHLIHERDALNRDAMYEAIRYGRGDMVIALAAKGARHNFSIVDLSVIAGNLKEAESLIAGANVLNRRADPVHGWSSLMVAVHFGRHEMVRRLLELGADPEAQSRSWGTALMSAARFGDMESLKLLLSAHADPNHAVDGTSPLALAIFGSHEEFALYLMENGADPSIHEKSGRGRLRDIATRRNLQRVVSELE